MSEEITVGGADAGVYLVGGGFRLCLPGLKADIAPKEAEALTLLLEKKLVTEDFLGLAWDGARGARYLSSGLSVMLVLISKLKRLETLLS